MDDFLESISQRFLARALSALHSRSLFFSLGSRAPPSDWLPWSALRFQKPRKRADFCWRGASTAPNMEQETERFFCENPACLDRKGNPTSFKTKKNLQDHLRRATKHAEKKKCRHCEIKILPASLSKHLTICKRNAENADDQVSCIKCHRCMSEEHFHKHHSKRCPGFLTCDKCGKKTSGRSQMITHMKLKHNFSAA